MEAIYANNCYVVETSGDGLMVLFLSEAETVHALEAVKSATIIRDNTLRTNQEAGAAEEPVVINIGISSGSAFVGTAKFESLTGSRWTYTSHGNTTNIAARICSYAKGGRVLVSKSTADRVKDHFPCNSMGYFRLKNVSEEVEIFSVVNCSCTNPKPTIDGAIF